MNNLFLFYYYYYFIFYFIIIIFLALQPNAGYGLLIHEIFS